MEVDFENQADLPSSILIFLPLLLLQQNCCPFYWFCLVFPQLPLRYAPWNTRKNMESENISRIAWFCIMSFESKLHTDAGVLVVVGTICQLKTVTVTLVHDLRIKSSENYLLGTFMGSLVFSVLYFTIWSSSFRMPFFCNLFSSQLDFLKFD